MGKGISITLAEGALEISEGTRIADLCAVHEPQADLYVRNGFPCSRETVLEEGDTVVLITRGRVPGPDELEALMVARHTPKVHEVLKRSVAGIAGLGGLGSSVAIALARVGIGRLVLADFDIVEPSNLNRQQYFIRQIGLHKTEALEENLKEVNPYVQVEAHCVRLTPENVAGIFGGVGVLVEAFDAAEEKAMLIECFGAAFPGTPIVAASGLAGHQASNTVVTRRAGRALYVVGDGASAAAPGLGLMAPRVGIAAHHQANAVLRLVLGEEPAPGTPQS